MFDLDQAIAEWRRQMAAGGIKSSEVLDELESHLREGVAQEIQSGCPAQQAFETTVQRIGPTAALKCEFDKVGATKWPALAKLKSFLTAFLGGPYAGPFPSLENFDASARQTLELARAAAPRFHHDFIGTEHVLLGLLTVETGTVVRVLRRCGVEREAIRLEIEKLVGFGPAKEATAAIPYTPRAKKALLLASTEAKTLNRPCVSSEHILLGLLREGSGVAALVLRNLGVRIEHAREEIAKELGRNAG